MAIVASIRAEFLRYKLLAEKAMAQVDERLRSALGLHAGLRSPNLALLDPALGTGVWLAAALERMTTARLPK